MKPHNSSQRPRVLVQQLALFGKMYFLLLSGSKFNETARQKFWGGHLSAEKAGQPLFCGVERTFPRNTTTSFTYYYVEQEVKLK